MPPRSLLYDERTAIMTHLRITLGVCKSLPIILLLANAVALSRAAESCGEISDKTLAAWLSPANLQQRGAGVVSMMRGEQFDAIVLGEIQQGRWMPGSDYFRRTARNQAAWPAETTT